MLRVLVFGGLALAATTVSTVHASIVTPLARQSELRVVRAYQPLGQPNPTITMEEASFSEFGLWNHSISVSAGLASQQSNTLGSGATAVLDAYGPLEGSEFGFYTAVSSFSFTFSVDAEREYELAGDITVDSVVPPGSLLPWSFAQVMLTGPGVAIDLTTAETRTFEYDGLLGPGEYTLYMEAHASEYWGVDIDLSGTLTVVPAPSCTVLLAGLLVPLLRRRRGA